MSDTDPATPRARRREPAATVPELVHKVEIDRAVEKAKTDLRREWAINLDRAALERATSEAKEAAREARAVARASRARFTVAMALISLLVARAVYDHVFSLTNRERIERLERITDDARP